MKWAAEDDKKTDSYFNTSIVCVIAAKKVRDKVFTEIIDFFYKVDKP